MRALIARTIAASLVLAVAGCPSNNTKKDDTPPDQPKTYEPGPPAPDPKGEEIAPGAMEIDLVTDDGVIIKGTLWSSGDEGQPTAIFIHQLNSERYEWQEFIEDLAIGEEPGPDEPLLPPVARVFAIDMRGHGESIHTTDGKTISHKDFSEDDWKSITLDVKAAVEYVRTLEPTTSRITLIGGSIGSSAAMLYAAEDDGIYTAVLLSPGTAYRGLAIQDAYDTVVARGGAVTPGVVASEGDTRSFESAEQLTGGDFHVVEGDSHGVSMLEEDPGLVSYVRDYVAAAD
jgi:pimeloyl-ACP methyl ester carboxylesterase